MAAHVHGPERGPHRSVQGVLSGRGLPSQGHLAIWAGGGCSRHQQVESSNAVSFHCAQDALAHSQGQPGLNANSTGVGRPATCPLLLGIPSGAFMGFEINPSRRKRSPSLSHWTENKHGVHTGSGKNPGTPKETVSISSDCCDDDHRLADLLSEFPRPDIQAEGVRRAVQHPEPQRASVPAAFDSFWGSPPFLGMRPHHSCLCPVSTWPSPLHSVSLRRTLLSLRRTLVAGFRGAPPPRG